MSETVEGNKRKWQHKRSHCFTLVEISNPIWVLFFFEANWNNATSSKQRGEWNRDGINHRMFLMRVDVFVCFYFLSSDYRHGCHLLIVSRMLNYFYMYFIITESRRKRFKWDNIRRIFHRSSSKGPPQAEGQRSRLLSVFTPSRSRSTSELQATSTMAPMATMTSAPQPIPTSTRFVKIIFFQKEKNKGGGGWIT